MLCVDEQVAGPGPGSAPLDSVRCGQLGSPARADPADRRLVHPRSRHRPGMTGRIMGVASGNVFTGLTRPPPPCGRVPWLRGHPGQPARAVPTSMRRDTAAANTVDLHKAPRGQPPARQLLRARQRNHGTATRPPTRSWLNLVERWFARRHKQAAKRRGTHRSTRELEQAILAWTKNWNENPRPFVWHKTADEILDTLAAYCAQISDSGH